MPRVGPRRENVVFRMGENDIKQLDERAAAEELQRSELLRIAVMYMLRNMPKGWRP